MFEVRTVTSIDSVNKDGMHLIIGPTSSVVTLMQRTDVTLTFTSIVLSSKCGSGTLARYVSYKVKVEEVTVTNNDKLASAGLQFSLTGSRKVNTLTKRTD